MAPAQIVLPFTGLEDPVGVAVDAAGDVYVAVEGTNTVLELPAGATSSSQVLTLPFGDSAPLSEPFGVAVDAAGDVYVTNEGSGQLAELPAACRHQLDCAVTIPLKGQGDQGLGNPLGIAVDAAGDVFVTMVGYANGSVVEVPAGCTSLACQVVFQFGPSNLYAVAVDAAGDIYVADVENEQIAELPDGCTSFACQVILPFTGLHVPFGVAVDAAGNVFVADTDNSRAVELPAGATSSSQQITLPFSGLDLPQGIAVDAAGNIYVAGAAGGFQEVVELTNATETTTSLGSSGNPSTVRAQVTYTATVTPAPTGGTISFTDNGSPITGCSAVSVSEGTAACPATPATTGAHNIVAAFSGSSGYAASTSPTVTQVVAKTSCRSLTGCNLSGLDLSGAQLASSDLAGSNLNGTNLSSANLTGANLSGANLNKADLAGADLAGADFTGANLNSADLSNANLTGASMTNANLNKVTWSNTTCPDGTNSNSDGETCTGHL